MHVSEPVFVVGVPRSGTTLLGELLNAHPQFAVFCESFLCRAASVLPDDVLEGEGRASEFAAFLMERFNPYGHGRRPTLAFLDSPDLRGRLLNAPHGLGPWLAVVFDAWREHERAATWADKATPAQAGEILAMYRLFPSARFVHIHRDPRSVARSLQAVGWARNAWGAGAAWHVAIAEIGRGLASVPEDQRWETSYEALCADPQRALADLCRFLAVPFADEMLENPRPVNPTLENISLEAITARAGHAIGEVRDRWRDEMSRPDVRIVEAVNKSAMVRYGYEPVVVGGNRTPHDVLRRFRYIRGRRRAAAARYDALRNHLMSAFG